jgi:hypothetical protein
MMPVFLHAGPPGFEHAAPRPHGQAEGRELPRKVPPAAEVGRLASIIRGFGKARSPPVPRVFKLPGLHPRPPFAAGSRIRLIMDATANSNTRARPAPRGVT